MDTIDFVHGKVSLLTKGGNLPIDLDTPRKDKFLTGAAGAIPGLGK